jgi:RNA polymerase sigma-70 factor (ECF subfamily)
MKANGNRTLAFDQASLEHLDALYGFAMVLTRDDAEAQDLVQETYLRAIRAFGRLMPDSNLKGWLFAIMRNIWLNDLRHKRNGPSFVELDSREEHADGIGTIGADPYFLYVVKLEREELMAATERLPQAYREIILLRHIEGFSYQEISAILGCPAGTVMSRLGRAREKLRALVIDLQSAVAGKLTRAVRS